jgi:hypothetical protein
MTSKQIAFALAGVFLYVMVGVTAYPDLNASLVVLAWPVYFLADVIRIVLIGLKWMMSGFVLVSAGYFLFVLGTAMMRAAESK